MRIYPFSTVFDPVNQNNFSTIHVGATNSRKLRGIGLTSSFGADTTLQLAFRLPPTLPTGTPKLSCLAVANATSGAIVFGVDWVSVDITENPDTATLNVEGDQTMTWSAGQNDDFKELKLNLDADTVTADEIVIMNIDFDATGSTITQVATMVFSIIIE